MNRKTCCTKEGLNRGAWTVPEDNLLASYINAHGEGKWTRVPMEAGLKRSGKSCRLRWLNYLSPNIKRGNFSEEEEDLIIRLQKLLGNRWSLIAGRLPGRTDNGIKNFWNTTLAKKVRSQQRSTQKPCTHARRPLCKTIVTTAPPSASPPPPQDETVLIRTKAIKCNRGYFPGSRVISSSPSAEPEETPVVPQIMHLEDTIISSENCSFDLHLDSLYDAMDLQGWFQLDAEVDAWWLG